MTLLGINIGVISIDCQNNTIQNTVLVLRMAHRIWKETKQEPGPAGPDNMLGC